VPSIAIRFNDAAQTTCRFAALVLAEFTIWRISVRDSVLFYSQITHGIYSGLTERDRPEGGSFEHWRDF
jgi:hypothetical protein